MVCRSKAAANALLSARDFLWSGTAGAMSRLKPPAGAGAFVFALLKPSTKFVRARAVVKRQFPPEFSLTVGASALTCSAYVSF